MVDFKAWQQIYLCNAMGHRLYPMSDINEDSVQFTPLLNGQWRLTFTITRQRDVHDVVMESICEGMYLFVEDVGYFKLRSPVVDINAATETKQIEALSCDAELEDKNIEISVNMGLETSQEYLVKYDDDEAELLLNPYKNVPYDWIVLDNHFPEQLEDFEAKLSSADFMTYDEIIDERESGVAPTRTIPPWIRDDGMHDPSGGTAHVRLRQPRKYGTDENPIYVDRYYMDVTDEYPDFKSELTSILTLIPRLAQKVSTVVPSGTADVVTVDDVEGTEVAQTYVEQYAEELRNDTEEVIGWRLYDSIFTHDIVQDDVIYEENAKGRTEDLAAFYRKYHDQLSLLCIISEKTGGNWTVGAVWGVDSNNYELANCKYQFDINETIYSFLTSTLAKKSRCVVNFDLMHRKINITPVEQIGKDTGIVIDYDTLLNSLHMQSDEAALCTRLNVRGGNDITLEQINFGDPYVEDLSYKMNVRNSQHERVYVSDALAEKYMRYREYRDDYARPKYIDMTRRYNTLIQEINELKYRVPNDGMAMDWGTCTDEELDELLIAYQRLLYSLLQLYGDDYAMPPDTRYWTEIIESQDPDSSGEWQYIDDDMHPVTLDPWFSGINANYGGSHYIPKPSVIVNTIYWWDYYAYHEILQQIKTAMAVRRSSTSDPGYSYKNITNEELLGRIKAWETEWSLYGSVELENKIAAYENQMQVMVDAVSVVRKHTSYEEFMTLNPTWAPIDLTIEREVAYAHMCTALARHALWESLSPAQQNYFGSIFDFETCKSLIQISEDIYEWTSDVAGNQLPDADKELFGNMEANYFYSDYQKILQYCNSAKVAKEAMDAEIDAKVALRDAMQSERTELADKMLLQNYSYSALYDVIDVEATGEDDGTESDQETPDLPYEMQLDNEGLQALSQYDPTYEDESFSTIECKCIVNMYRDADYTNENILTTSLNNVVDSLPHLQELYDDANEQLSKLSRPQLQFTVDSDNFLAIPDFAPFMEHFDLGNYISVAYRDGTYVRLRMIEYGLNPFLPHTGLTMKFSSYIRSQTDYSDVESVLGMAGTNGVSSYGGSSGGGGGGTAKLGEDLAIDVTISNTMLGRLLQPGGLSDSLSENLGISSLSAKALAQQIANAIRIGNVSSGNAALASGFTILTKQAAKDPVYVGLKDGSTVVSADCLQGGRIESLYGSVRPVYQTNSDGEYVLDANGARIPVYQTDDQGNIIYDEENNPIQRQQWEPYSWFDLDRGRISFGGGALTFERETDASVGQLAVQGIIKATGGNIGDLLIGATTIDQTLYNRMIIGKNGFYKYDTDASGNVVGLMDFRPANSVDISTMDNVSILAEQRGFIRLANRQFDNAGNMIVNEQVIMSPLETMFVGTTVSGVQQSVVIRPGSGIATIEADGTILADTFMSMSTMNSSSESFTNVSIRGHTTYGDAAMTINGKILAKSPTCTVSGTADTSNSLDAKFASAQYTGYTNSSGNHRHSLPTTADIVISGPSGTVPDDSVNEGSNNRSIKAQYNDSTYAALYSNGNIRATHCIRGASVYASTTRLAGADYAELFEWIDGNANGEDRRGLMVVLDGEKIRLANANDSYILGIISANPSVVGDASFEEWQNKYLRDAFGAILYEPVEIPPVVDEQGNIAEQTRVEYKPIMNPDYDPDQKYIPREERKEWTAVGLIGKLVLVDNGTCEVNGFAAPADNGVATKADGITNYRVMKRIDENHVLVAAK